MNGDTGLELHDSEFVEVDPCGRYGRYNEILGKGATKIVYKAFDEYQGIEVAWNQVKLHEFLQNPDDLQRLYREIHLLKTLKHRNIMKFYASWVDTSNMNINFVTEMFTSGTLRQYRMKHRRVNIRAVKHWCRQILKGLLYLHSRDPPIIHRDLKCDNIFINGNHGEVKIGDLGLAAILRKSHAACCVGTPEFMAPEVYAEEYNELVDIYSFGMCILEMVTFEYPYSECTNPAQIYKKVMSGKKPESLYKVEDPEVRRFVEKCLASVSSRLSARELLCDPFLQSDEYGSELRTLDYWRDFGDSGLIGTLELNHGRYLGCGVGNGSGCHPVDYEASELDLFVGQDDDDHLENDEIIIDGKRREDDGIFLRLRIADKEGRVRNIYFPFDMHNDTALSVATEMVAELDITDQDVTKIEDMIDGEIASLAPEWKKGVGIEDSLDNANVEYCKNCASGHSLVDYLPSDHPGAKNLQVLQCSKHGCVVGHGRFEEITYQFDGSEHATDSTPLESHKSGSIHYADIWAQRDGPELGLLHSCEHHSGDENEASARTDENVPANKDKMTTARPPLSSSLPTQASTEDFENEIRRELRWLKAKYQLQLRELRDQQLGVVSKSDKDERSESAIISSEETDKLLEKPPFASGSHPTAYFPADPEKKLSTIKLRNYYEPSYIPCSEEHMVTANKFYTTALLPQSLHRATSLPVDATDF